MTQHLDREAIPGTVPSVRPVGPIVLGTEFGPVSSAAERVAIRLAAQAAFPLLIVHGSTRVGCGCPAAGSTSASTRPAPPARAGRGGPDGPRPQAGVEPQLLIWDGDPATCILDAARAEGASRIVVGSHGRGRLGRALAGSVSATVAAQADCPVDIVRGDAPVGPVVARA